MCGVFIQWDADEMNEVSAFISFPRTLSLSPMFCTPVEAQFLTCEAGPRQFTDHGTGKPVRDLPKCIRQSMTDIRTILQGMV